jgi:di/tricarboxylate transporter
LSIHVAGIIGLVVVFLIGTLRPINVGALSLVMMFALGTIYGESVQDMYRGFPVDLFVLLAGVTYLFGVASNNGTLDRIVEAVARVAGDRRALIPWAVFIVAAADDTGCADGNQCGAAGADLAAACPALRHRPSVFPKSTGDADRKIAWGVVLLVCGVVTYVAALQRYGTIEVVGNSIAAVRPAIVAGLLICVVGAITSSVSSTIAILGALTPLAVPLMVRDEISTTGLIIALAISTTVVAAFCSGVLPWSSQRRWSPG